MGGGWGSDDGHGVGCLERFNEERRVLFLGVLFWEGMGDWIGFVCMVFFWVSG